MASKTTIFIGFSLLLLVCLTAGCPDYSHQRPVPDYENMVDPGGENFEVDPGGENSEE